MINLAFHLFGFITWSFIRSFAFKGCSWRLIPAHPQGPEWHNTCCCCCCSYYVYFFLIHQRYSINETLETTASTKTTKMLPNKIPFSEDNFTLVKRPGAQGSAYAAEHFPFQRKFIYMIGCHLQSAINIARLGLLMSAPILMYAHLLFFRARSNS